MENKKIKLFVSIFTSLVVSLIVFMYFFKGMVIIFDNNFPNFDKSILPLINAILNSLVLCSLLMALYNIKNKNIIEHKRYILIACILSSLFLINYVFYHFISENTKFGGNSYLKLIYFFILISHIVLAALILPFILYTLILGLDFQVEKHRKLAKIVMPIWMYVALTGVIVYIFIRPYY